MYGNSGTRVAWVALVLALGAMLMLGVIALPKAAMGQGQGKTEDMCPEGTTFLVKFEADGSSNQTAEGVTVTFDGSSATFTSDTEIAAVVVKSGQEIKTVEFNPPATSPLALRFCRV